MRLYRRLACSCGTFLMGFFKRRPHYFYELATESRHHRSPLDEVHAVGVEAVPAGRAGGLGNLGNEQLEWLEDDLKGRSASTPIVVFAHIPLWDRICAVGASFLISYQVFAHQRPDPPHA
jgi:hypothetical protein